MTKLTPKKIIIILIIALVAMAAVAFLMLFFDKSSVQAPEGQNESVVQQPPVERPKEVEVRLPGAEPITALKEDYNSNASLWRVVSKDYPLDDAANYVPDLAPASLPSAYGHQLRPDATAAADEMFQAAKAEGYNLIVGSGYRSYATQASIFNGYAASNGEAEANLFSARPGQSEHQTGLAFDVARSDQRCFIDSCFGTLPEGKWIAENSYKYGFILRYPADKTEITKYIYEPWHIRFVGKDLAKAIFDSGLTLDEARPYLMTALDELKKDGQVQ